MGFIGLCALAAAACGGDDEESTTGSGGTDASGGTAGSSGSGGSGGSSAAGSAGSAGMAAAGGSAGSGGFSAAGGSAGSAAAAGSGGGGFEYQDFAGCQFSTATDLTTSTAQIQIKGFAYDPPCVIVSVGQPVTISANNTHPLKGNVAEGTSPNPIAEGEPVSGFTTDQVFTFSEVGSYGYYCVVHVSMGMEGVVYVVE